MEWHRISVFQLVSLKLIVRGMLKGCPEHADRSTARLPDIYVPKELPHTRLAFGSDVLLFVSEHNPGAKHVARVLQAGMGGKIELTSDSKDLPTRENSRRTTRLRFSAAKQEHATHFLLYLSELTFAEGEDGELLADQVRHARSAELPIVMVHENDPGNHGCAFGHFFGCTPSDLIGAGLYNDLAVSYYPGPYRPTSIAMVAQKLGATDG